MTRPAADRLPRRPGPRPAGTPRVPTTAHFPTGQRGRAILLEQALQPFLAESRRASVSTRSRQIRRHVEISLQRADRPPEPSTGRLPEPPDRGAERPGPRRADLPGRGTPRPAQRPAGARLRELEMERHCTIADITHLGRAWVLPHPERATPRLAPMVRTRDRADRRRVRHRARGGAGLAGRERRVREPGLRPDLAPAAPRRPEDVHRGPVHRGEGPGGRRARSP